MRDSAEISPDPKGSPTPEPALLSQGGLAGVQPLLDDEWPADESFGHIIPEESIELFTGP